MLIYGIDPGYTGAIAIYTTKRKELIVHDMPIHKGANGKSLINLHQLLQDLTNVGKQECLAVLERVSAMPGQGVTSTFRFGQGFGHLEMGIAASGLPLKYIQPQQWKRYFGLTKDKNQSRELAMERFPDNADLFKRKKDDGRAEAALIALYGAEKLI